MESKAAGKNTRGFSNCCTRDKYFNFPRTAVKSGMRSPPPTPSTPAGSAAVLHASLQLPAAVSTLAYWISNPTSPPPLFSVSLQRWRGSGSQLQHKVKWNQRLWHHTHWELCVFASNVHSVHCLVLLFHPIRTTRIFVRDNKQLSEKPAADLAESVLQCTIFHPQLQIIRGHKSPSFLISWLISCIILSCGDKKRCQLVLQKGPSESS